MRFTWMLVCVVVLLFPSFARADIAPEKKQAIQELLKLSHMDEIMNNMATQMSAIILDGLTKSCTKCNQVAIDDAKDEMAKVFKEEIAKGSLYELIYPIYDQHFSTEDLQAVVAFYKTPAGAKMMSELPAVTKESMQAGQQWGQSIAPVIQQRIQARWQKDKVTPQ